MDYFGKVVKFSEVFDIYMYMFLSLVKALHLLICIFALRLLLNVSIASSIIKAIPIYYKLLNMNFINYIVVLPLLKWTMLRE